MATNKSRCPNGSRRTPPKTGICIKNKTKKKRVCPNNKLLNPKTNRCLIDNIINRKKLNLNKKKRFKNY